MQYKFTSVRDSGNVKEVFNETFSNIKTAGYHGGVQPNTARERARENLKSCVATWLGGDLDKKSGDIPRCDNKNVRSNADRNSDFESRVGSSNSALNKVAKKLCGSSKIDRWGRNGYVSGTYELKISGSNNCSHKSSGRKFFYNYYQLCEDYAHARFARDTDNDSIPDEFDFDDDGDGLSDSADLCPKNKTKNCGYQKSAVRLGKILGKACGNNLDDCPLFNGYDQYLDLETMKLSVNNPFAHWWTMLKFWHTPSSQGFFPKCLNENGGETRCFNGDKARESSLLTEGLYRGHYGTGTHKALGFDRKDNRAWLFTLPKFRAERGGYKGTIKGIPFHNGCLGSSVSINGCNERTFSSDNITLIAPVVRLKAKDYLVNYCDYSIDIDYLANTSNTVDDIVNRYQDHMKRKCQSSPEQLLGLAYSNTSTQKLQQILDVQYDLDLFSQLEGGIIFHSLKYLEVAAEEGSAIYNLALAANRSIRVGFALQNLKGFISGIKSFDKCETNSCKTTAAVEILVSGFFLGKDTYDVSSYARNGRLSSLLDELDIENDELSTFLDEELEPLLGTVEETRGKNLPARNKVCK